VSLLFALACCTHVPIFDIKAACVAHILVFVPLHFVCIHFVWGLLSLLHSSRNIQDQLRQMVWEPVDCLYLGIVVHAHCNCVRLRILLHVHGLQSVGVCCSTLVDIEVMLGVGRSMVGRVQFVTVAPLPVHLGTHLPMTSLPFNSGWLFSVGGVGMCLAVSCWRDAYICIACLLIVAIVWAERFAMCKWVAPAVVSAVLLSESLFVARPEKRSFWLYPPCVDVIVPDARRCW
jgi:hypothetical protein